MCKNFRKKNEKIFSVAFAIRLLQSFAICVLLFNGFLRKSEVKEIQFPFRVQQHIVQNHFQWKRISVANSYVIFSVRISFKQNKKKIKEKTNEAEIKRKEFFWLCEIKRRINADMENSW